MVDIIYTFDTVLSHCRWKLSYSASLLVTMVLPATSRLSTL